MTKTVLIEVTQEDIDGGERVHAFSCPLALAIARGIGLNKVGVAVGAVAQVDEDENETLWETDLPKDIWDWYLAFDRGEVVAPTSFDLEIPDELPATPSQEKGA